MQHHTNVPDNYIYVYSFALKPESHHNLVHVILVGLIKQIYY